MRMRRDTGPGPESGSHFGSKPVVRSVLVLVMLCFAAPAVAEEIFSNRAGGGRWSDPTTWTGGQVPSADDVVVIAARDTVIFDGNDEDAASCAGLVVNRQGVLTFQANAHRHVLSVAGVVENHGIIRVNATDSPRGRYELRLVADREEERVIRLYEHSALLTYGAGRLGENVRNIIISSLPAGETIAGLGSIEAGRAVQIDLHHTELGGLAVRLEGLDNTGYRSSERLNIVGCRFVGGSSLHLTECDTPSIKNNVFSQDDESPAAETALEVRSSRIAQVIANTITGFETGAAFSSDVNSTFAQNVIRDCERGVSWSGEHAMIRDSRFEGCDVGITLGRTTGVLEQLIFEEIREVAVVSGLGSNFQISNCYIGEMPEGRTKLRVDRSTVQLLNCNIEPDEIHFPHPHLKPSRADDWVQSLKYLVVGIDGERERQTQVSVETVGLDIPDGAADPNVRNSPAPVLGNGTSPPPRTQRALIVHAWNMPVTESRDPPEATEPPEYRVLVWVPPADGESQRRILGEKQVRSDQSWYRPPDAGDKPTLTVELGSGR